MTIYNKYIFPVPSTNSVGLVQSVDANIPLVFNGGIYNTNNINFIDYGFVPNISLTSVGNLSAVTFKIEGYQNGVYITENLIGPNNTTISSVNYYDRLVSITPLQTSLIPVSIGTFRLGYLPIIRLNTLKKNVTNFNYSLHISVPVGLVSFQIYKSLKDCYNQGNYDTLINTNDFSLIDDRVGFSNSVKIEYNDIASNLLIKIYQNAGNRSLTARFMQL